MFTVGIPSDNHNPANFPLFGPHAASLQLNRSCNAAQHMSAVPTEAPRQPQLRTRTQLNNPLPRTPALGARSRHRPTSSKSPGSTCFTTNEKQANSAAAQRLRFRADDQPRCALHFDPPGMHFPQKRHPRNRTSVRLLEQLHPPWHPEPQMAPGKAKQPRRQGMLAKAPCPIAPQLQPTAHPRPGQVKAAECSDPRQPHNSSTPKPSRQSMSSPLSKPGKTGKARIPRAASRPSARQSPASQTPAMGIRINTPASRKLRCHSLVLLGRCGLRTRNSTPRPLPIRQSGLAFPAATT